ncbi:hypothetical protein [Acinetobacter sp. ANC 5414]|uniref:hypothetical protein n=1 Tax=Acinetobacter sp. ANC 5414 TaxID=2731251 RepID=UPI00148FDC6B|nr:hypothetical protein [Acinetobacter sp. ANC 5414]NNH00627.1 hypothetical protein [Acinetobacter sp. ANC 5414]
MKKFLLMFTCSSFLIPISHACSIASVSESYMQMLASYKSQTATSFNVRCDRGYVIQFSSRNLQDKHGLSYVTNGAHRLRTRMSIIGAQGNLWNTPLSAKPAKNGQKYVVAVQLDEQPGLAIPSGNYTDELYVNLLF